MVPLVVRLTVKGGTMVALNVLVGEGGVVRARADDRLRRKARVCRVSFIVVVLEAVRLLRW